VCGAIAVLAPTASLARGFAGGASRSPAPPRRRSRVTLHEEASWRVQYYQTPAAIARGLKEELVQALASRDVREKAAIADLRKLVVRLAGLGSAAGVGDVRQLLTGTWRSIGFASSASQDAPARVSLFSGGHFVFEGSTLNGALFRGVLQEHAEGAEIDDWYMRVADHEMVVFGSVVLPSGRREDVAYTARLDDFSGRPSGRGQSIMQRITSLDMPSPIGPRTPILEGSERLTVPYIDSQMAILADPFGNFEVFLRSMEAAVAMG